MPNREGAFISFHAPLPRTMAHGDWCLKGLSKMPVNLYTCNVRVDIYPSPPVSQGTGSQGRDLFNDVMNVEPSMI